MRLVMWRVRDAGMNLPRNLSELGEEVIRSRLLVLFCAFVVAAIVAWAALT